MGHLWLIGMMGSGKTSVGRSIAASLQVEFVDTDDIVVSSAGRSIAEIWHETGEKGFREMEAAAVQAASCRPPAVIATGGGAVLDDANVAAMRASGTVVWLDVPADVLGPRIDSGDDRPLLDRGSIPHRLEAILAEREARYRDAAHHRVAAEDMATAQRRIEELWKPS